MAYVNPLHPPIHAAHLSSYSSLLGATDCPPQEPQFLSPHRRRVPFIPYAPSSKWRNVTGRVSQVHHPISFDFIGHKKQGVPMRELIARGAHGLEAMVHGASDQVLAQMRLEKLTLRIQWPGYEYVDWARVIELNPHGSMTRGQLGAVVAMNFARFMEKARTEQATSPEWMIGFNNIRFEHLVLISICNVFEDVWQADLAIDLR